MMRGGQPWLVNIDFRTFSLYLALVGIGWMMIFTVGRPPEGYSSDLATYLVTPSGKQTIWIFISLLVFGFIFFFVEHRFWQNFAYALYGVSIFLLVLVLLVGTNIKGATSWFTFGGMAFQPSELAKFSTCLAVAAYVSNWRTDLGAFRSAALAFALFLAPAALILVQPDAGSALVFFSFLLVLYREGLAGALYIVGIFTVCLLLLGIVVAPEYLLVGLMGLALVLLGVNAKKSRSYWVLAALIVTGIAYYLLTQNAFSAALIGFGVVFGVYAFSFYKMKRARLVGLLSVMLIYGTLLVYSSNYIFYEVLQPHQQERINVWLRPDLADPQGARYNVLQSQMAISAGGLLGKGLMKGTMTKYDYVPEQLTDFIFCAVGEEQGFVGVLAVILLFLMLLLRILKIAERQRHRFNRIYAYGVAGILFVHVLVNIGMTMGLLPIIGIPLPFVSKGGSSLLGFTVMLAVLLKMDKHRNRFKKFRF